VLLTLRVPVPCPPDAAPHNCQVMAVTVMFPVAHPTLSRVGRTCGVDLGPQDRTAGRGGVVVVEATVVVVVIGEVEVVVNP